MAGTILRLDARPCIGGSQGSVGMRDEAACHLPWDDSGQVRLTVIM